MKECSEHLNIKGQRSGRWEKNGCNQSHRRKSPEKKIKNHFGKILFRLPLPPHKEKSMFNTLHHIHHHSALRHTGRQWRW
jgi:hypothetical protein